MLTSNNHKNILLIIADQLRYDTIGYVNNIAKTPNIDKLAQQSTRFTKVYAQSPQCQPSRASIFTGRYPTSHRVWWNSIDLPVSEITIGHMLQDTHATAFFGKSHFSNDDSYSMPSRGFRYSYLYDHWKNDIPWDVTYHPHKEMTKLMRHKYWCGTLSNDGIYHDDIVTQRAINWIQDQTTPYFAVVSLLSPHPPYAAPKHYNNIYDGTQFQLPQHQTYDINGNIIPNDAWHEIKLQYYSMISWLDQLVGQLIDTVESDTTIIFTSDHGDILGDHGYFSKGLFAYEGNTRIPLLIRDNNMLKCQYDHIIQSIDILPTILSMCNKHVPFHIQGKDIVSAVNHSQPINKYALSMVGYDTRLRMILNDRYKYWCRANKHYLFDLVNDPDENNNIKDQKLILEMRSQLLSALIENEDKLPLPNPSK